MLHGVSELSDNGCYEACKYEVFKMSQREQQRRQRQSEIDNERNLQVKDQVVRYDRLIRLKEVMDLTGLSRTTIWRLEKDKRFPARVQISPNCIGWKSSLIQEFIESRTTIAA